MNFAVEDYKDHRQDARKSLEGVPQINETFQMWYSGILALVGEEPELIRLGQLYEEFMQSYTCQLRKSLLCSNAIVQRAKNVATR